MHTANASWCATGGEHPRDFLGARYFQAESVHQGWRDSALPAHEGLHMRPVHYKIKWTPASPTWLHSGATTSLQDHRAQCAGILCIYAANACTLAIAGVQGVCLALGCACVITHRQEQPKQTRPAIHTTTINPSLPMRYHHTLLLRLCGRASVLQLCSFDYATRSAVQTNV